MRKHVGYMVGALLCILPPVALYAADRVTSVHWYDIGNRVEILGQLGPIGHLVTVEVKRVKTGTFKGAMNDLLVDKLNGKPLAQPVLIEPESINKLPVADSYILKGYETGRMIGVPEDVLTKTGDDAPQAVWHFNVSFVVVEVEIPAFPR